MGRGACVWLLGGASACTSLTGLDNLAFTGAGGGGSATTGTAPSSSSVSTGGGMAGGGGAAGAAGGDGYAAEVLADDPLAYWRLGEPPGALMAIDQSGNGRDGAYIGGVSLGAAGAVAGDGAAHFDGSGRVVVGDHFDFVAGQAFSLEAWIKQDDTQLGYQGVCSKLDAPLGEGYVLYTTNPRHPKFSVYSADVAADAALAGETALGVYAHLVATFDGSTARLFVNGIQVAGVAAVGPSVDVSVAFEIGNNHEGNELIGTIDEVAVYGTALPEARIKAHYDAAERSP